MSFLVYFFVLLVTAAGVLFGLDLVNAPLYPPPDVAIGRSMRHVAAEPAALAAKAKSEIGPATKRQTAADNARKPATETARAENRELTPIYPAGPGPSTTEKTSGNASADRTAAREPRHAATSTKPDADEPAKPDSKTDAAPAARTPSATAVPVADGGRTENESRQARNSCNVQACAAAYRSFRVSDCTYQPNYGPRRLCTRSDGADPRTLARRDGPEAAARIVRDFPRGEAARRPVRRDDQLSEAARIVRKMTRGRGLGDIPVQRADGSIIIVHTGGARAQAR